MRERIDALLGEMTLEEKVAMTAGRDMWHSTAVPRLGIPSFKVSDGPVGVRGAEMRGGPTAACFPCGTALGATWNRELIESVGAALGEELRTKGAHVLLGPTVNIHRTPLAGRSFECYSEDPHLTASIAVAFIRGVQSRGVGTSIKHFVCNDSEFERHTISSEVDERTLREIYLLPFERAVTEAQPWSVMSAYNRLNGTYCSANNRLLTQILKQEWGFEGFVISDWFGTRDSVGIANGGLDLEMPGAARFAGEKLLDPLKRGLIEESTIDDKVRRLLRILLLSGALTGDGPGEPERDEEAIDRPEHREIARRAAVESIVLLRHERDVLPLDPAKLQSLAVIGPNAMRAVIQGGGSAQVPPHYSQTPFDAITAACGDRVDVRYAIGCTNHKLLPDLDAARIVAASDGVPGFTAEYFDSPDLSGGALATVTVCESQITWFGNFPKGVDPQRFSVKLTGRFTATEDGDYTFGLTSAGLSRLLVDGEVLVDNWTNQTRGAAFFGLGSTEVTAACPMTAGRTVDLEIQYTRGESRAFAALKIGCLAPLPADPLGSAAELAAVCDAAVVVVGLNGDWESEGHDRSDIELVGDQNALVERVAAANPNTVVVLNCGAPVTLPWLERVPAVLQTWYGGQEAGNALADVLLGVRCPSGKLPTTFPRRLEDTPAYLDYPGENGRVRYGEGLFVGYRYYDTRSIEPLFPFGHGLSYTQFRYGSLELSSLELSSGQDLDVTLILENCGDRVGAEVVQLYVRDVDSRLARPRKELRAFEKVELDAGARREIRFQLSQRALSYYDPEQAQWVAEPGEFEIQVGSSSRDIRSRATFVLLPPS